MITRPYRFGPIAPLVLIAFLTFTGMYAFQVLRHFLWPSLTIWGYHFQTAVFITAVATGAGFFACRYLEASALLASIVESSEDAIIGVTLDGTILSWNRGAEKIYGYSAGEVVGKHVSILLPDDLPDDAANNLARIRRGEQVEQYDTISIRKDGKRVHIHLAVSPILNAAGQIIGASSIARDITRRKEAEEELKQTSAYLENVFNSSPDAIVIVDQHGKLIKWNKMAAETYGYAFEELQGKSSFDFYADRDQLERMLQHLRQHGSVRSQTLMTKKDGSVAPFEVFIWLLQDDEGGVLGSVSAARDLSEIRNALVELKASHERLSKEIIVRKQAEEAVQQLSRQNQLILDAAGEGIVGLDLSGRITFINPAGAGLAGYEVEELLQKDFHETIHCSMPDAAHYPKHQCPMFQCLTNGAARHEIEEEFRRKDGTSFQVEYSSTPILQEGKILGAVLTFRDITQRKLAQEELNKYRDHLEELVKERTTELAMANEQLVGEIEERRRAEDALQDSSEKLKLFAYSVVHDLKSPAIGIHGLTQFLHKQYNHLFDEKGAMYCEQVLKLSEHVGALVEQINVFIATKATPLLIEPLELKNILCILRDEFSSRLSIRRIDWIEPEIKVDFTADRISILRAFRNLIDNAFKYGGDQLSKIRIEYEESADFHIFSVSNDGAEIKEIDAERIFGVFQRDSSSKGIEGAGLGLAIVKEIVERHGGKVWMEPYCRNESTFNLSISKNLPCAK